MPHGKELQWIYKNRGNERGKKVVLEPNIDMFGISKNKNAFLYETQDKMTRLSTANLLSATNCSVSKKQNQNKQKHTNTV